MGPDAESEITSADIEAVVGLLGSIAGMTAPIVQRRRRLMEGISQLSGADIWAWVHMRVPLRGMPVAFRSMDGGWRGEDERARALEAANDPANNDVPIYWARRCLAEKRALITAFRRRKPDRPKRRWPSTPNFPAPSAWRTRFSSTIRWMRRP